MPTSPAVPAGPPVQRIPSPGRDRKPTTACIRPLSADHHSRCGAVPAASRFAERTARAAGLSADDVRATTGFCAQIMPFAERPVPAVRQGCPRQNPHPARRRRGRSAALCTAAHHPGFDTQSRHAERT